MSKNLISQCLLLSSVAFALSACGNLSKVDENGYTDNPIFPKISERKFNLDGSPKGSFPNWENVARLEKGMNKEQLFELLGHPHFGEGLYAVREWDYLFNYTHNGINKVCQFKILFDKDMIAQNFLWYPNGCQGETVFNLSGDFLFEFNQDTLTEEGKKTIVQIAEQLKSKQFETVKVVGYTDKLGSDQYNLELSQRRANTVKSYLNKYEIGANISAIGYGKAYPVKACDKEKNEELIKCLAPNRRVEIIATGSVDDVNNYQPGPKGPDFLYHSPINGK